MSKLELYKLLGAETFQKVVFKVEELKYKLFDKIPNIESKIDKFIDWQYDLKIRFNEDKKEELEEKRKFSKMRARKEIYTKQNINYHCDLEYPIEFIRQLEFNKKVHVKGMILNIGTLFSLLVGYFVFSLTFPVMLLLGIQQAISLIVNFECVNLQNYNLERFNDEKTNEVFKKKTVRSYQSNYRDYGHASEKIKELIQTSSTIPSVTDTIEAMKTREEREELLALAQKQKKKLVLTRKVR